MSRIRSSSPRSPGLRPCLALLSLVLALLPAVVVRAQDADHLLLDKVLVQTRTPYNLFGSPFIEIVNPTGSAVDLTGVYLSTAQNTDLGRLYWNVVTGEDMGGGASGNVHARFPDGMSLAPGESLVISLNGSGQFVSAYGHLPHLELFEDGPSPDQVPEMVEVFDGSIGAGLGSSGGNTPALSTSSDSIVLYRWDGASDLVEDLDYFFYGTDTRVRVDKTGVTVGAGTYLDDTPVASQTSAGPAAGFGYAHVRNSAVEEGETQTGGNGVTGHDETSEDLASSWQTLQSQQPAPEPATFFPPAPIVLSASSSAAANNQPVYVNAQFVSYDTVTDVTVHYRVDGGAWLDVAATSDDGESWLAELPAQPTDTIVDWYLVAVTAAGGQATWPVAGERAPRSYTVVSNCGGKLLITEVSVVDASREFVEIANPCDSEVDLSDYYLTDAIHAPLDQYYWHITEGNPTQATVGGGDYSDFHARFPDGFVLAGGDTIVVSIAGSDAYFAAFGFLPHLELFEDGATPDDVPDMRPVFGTAGEPDNSINGQATPTLTDTDESITLYYWDGATNLVTDIDIFFWDSVGEDANTRYSKTGVVVNGEPYQDETSLAQQQPFATPAVFGSSFQRIDPFEGAQPGPPGNGVGGRDEVGEDWPNTFALQAYSPVRPPVDIPLILSVFNTPAYVDTDIRLRVEVLADDPLSAVTVFYALDGGDETGVEAVENASGGWDAVIPGQPLGTVVDYRVVAEDIEGDAGSWPEEGATATLTVVEAPDPDTVAQHLLITEVRNRGAEFIEIHNPLDHDVALGRYHLTDAVYSPGEVYYWRITEGNPSSETIGGGDFFDFHGRFPADAVIAAGQTITVALSGSGDFYGDYFEDPDYELFEDGAQPDEVPELEEVFAGSLRQPDGSAPTLSNGAETVVLYWWDGASELVTDVDVFFWDTDGSGESSRFSKNGVVVGGSTYGAELQVSQQQPHLEPTGSDLSYTRLGPEETGEDQEGFGNGTDGHDETSEVFMESFGLLGPSPGLFLTQPEEGERGEVTLVVPARTFVPDLETFPIQFTTRRDNETKIRIIDLEGRNVVTLYDSRFDAPASTVPGVYTQRRWDGRDDTYQRVRAGAYVIHLQAVDRTTGEKIVKTAPVVVATRLK